MSGCGEWFISAIMFAISSFSSFLIIVFIIVSFGIKRIVIVSCCIVITILFRFGLHLPVRRYSFVFYLNILTPDRTSIDVCVLPHKNHTIPEEETKSFYANGPRWPPEHFLITDTTQLYPETPPSPPTPSTS